MTHADSSANVARKAEKFARGARFPLQRIEAEWDVNAAGVGLSGDSRERGYRMGRKTCVIVLRYISTIAAFMAMVLDSKQ